MRYDSAARSDKPDMELDVLNKAIAAHGSWKVKLKAAIQAEGTTLDPAQVSRDNACEFGQWLHAVRPAAAHAADYARVKELHAEFHRRAGEVASLARLRKRVEAEKSMGLGGAFFEASVNLVSAMQAWKKKV